MQENSFIFKEKPTRGGNKSSTWWNESRVGVNLMSVLLGQDFSLQIPDNNVIPVGTGHNVLAITGYAQTNAVSFMLLKVFPRAIFMTDISYTRNFYIEKSPDSELWQYLRKSESHLDVSELVIRFLADLVDFNNSFLGLENDEGFGVWAPLDLDCMVILHIGTNALMIFLVQVLTCPDKDRAICMQTILLLSSLATQFIWANTC